MPARYVTGVLRGLQQSVVATWLQSGTKRFKSTVHIGFGPTTA